MKKFLLALFIITFFSGCGYIQGKRIDFPSWYADSPYPQVRELAGQSFYVTNYDDYDALVELKKELRDLLNMPTPSRYMQADCLRQIVKITDKYHSGVPGFLFGSRIVSKSPDQEAKPSESSQSDDSPSKWDQFLNWFKRYNLL